MNEPLIRKVVEHIETNPEQWNQATYGVDLVTEDGRLVGSYDMIDLNLEATWIKDETCGTTACFAGWALALSGELAFRGDEFDDAKKLLGLTEEQAGSIFHWFGDQKFVDPTDKVVALKKLITEVTGLEL